MDILRLGGDQIRYFVKKNPDSKYVQLKFRPNLELEVTVPSDRYGDVRKILWKKRHWIQRKYEEIAACRRIFDGKRVLYKGTYCTVAFDRRGRKQAKVVSNRILLPLYNNEDPQEALKRWMSTETRKFVQKRLSNYRRRLISSFNGLSVKDTRKWAYCMKNHHLVFNWRLIALPSDLADYVVLHEISHLREFNHSRGFRYALASLCPDFKEKEAMLKRYVID